MNEVRLMVNKNMERKAIRYDMKKRRILNAQSVMQDRIRFEPMYLTPHIEGALFHAKKLYFDQSFKYLY